jgi:MATE family multidrug resistance protein
LLAYGLIYGAFGLPNLDMLGAGVATTIVNILMLIACFYVAYTQEPFRKYRILSGFWRWDWPLLRRLLWIGAPISAAFFIEYGLFSATSLIMGAIGAAELAAHQVALQTATILFMGPFGLSMAATVRVGHAIGRGDLPAARRAGFSAFVIGFVFMLGMTAVIASARHVIPHAFLGGQTSPETIAMAATLLLVGTSFFVFDGVQTVAAGALRGMSDTRVPALRKRLEDIPLLAEHFLARSWDRHRPHGTPAPEFTSEALAFLQSRPWRGNVRELRNYIERRASLSTVVARLPADAAASSLASFPASNRSGQ